MVVTSWGKCYWNLPRLPGMFRHMGRYVCIYLDSWCTKKESDRGPETERHVMQGVFKVVIFKGI